MKQHNRTANKMSKADFLFLLCKQFEGHVWLKKAIFSKNAKIWTSSNPKKWTNLNSKIRFRHFVYTPMNLLSKNFRFESKWKNDQLFRRFLLVTLHTNPCIFLTLNSHKKDWVWVEKFGPERWVFHLRIHRTLFEDNFFTTSPLLP